MARYPHDAERWGFLCYSLNTLRPRQTCRHFADDILKWIFFNENVWILLKISLKFVPKVRINNIPALVQIMAWRWPGDKPLSEPMVVWLLTHICVTRPQWVKQSAEYMVNLTVMLCIMTLTWHKCNEWSVISLWLDVAMYHIYGWANFNPMR